MKCRNGEVEKNVASLVAVMPRSALANKCITTAAKPVKECFMLHSISTLASPWLEQEWALLRKTLLTPHLLQAQLHLRGQLKSLVRSRRAPVRRKLNCDNAERERSTIRRNRLLFKRQLKTERKSTPTSAKAFAAAVARFPAPVFVSSSPKGWSCFDIYGLNFARSSNHEESIRGYRGKQPPKNSSSP